MQLNNDVYASDMLNGANGIGVLLTGPRNQMRDATCTRSPCIAFLRVFFFVADTDDVDDRDDTLLPLLSPLVNDVLDVTVDGETDEGGTVVGPAAAATATFVALVVACDGLGIDVDVDVDVGMGVDVENGSDVLASVVTRKRSIRA
jgi:hypothetical protein